MVASISQAGSTATSRAVVAIAHGLHQLGGRHRAAAGGEALARVDAEPRELRGDLARMALDPGREEGPVLVEGEPRQDRLDPGTILAEADQLVHAEPDHLVIEHELADGGRDAVPDGREHALDLARARLDREVEPLAQDGERALDLSRARREFGRSSARPTRSRSRAAPRTAIDSSRVRVASDPPWRAPRTIAPRAAHGNRLRAPRDPARRANLLASKRRTAGGSCSDRPGGASVKATGHGSACLGALLALLAILACEKTPQEGRARRSRTRSAWCWRGSATRS